METIPELWGQQSSAIRHPTDNSVPVLYEGWTILEFQKEHVL
jgi:hypothetical protein